MAKKETKAEVGTVATEKAPKAPKVTRADKIAAVVAGKTFELVDTKTVDGEFTCICGGKGKHAYVAKASTGEEIKVGTSCLKHLGIEIPKTPRKATRGPKAKKAKEVVADVEAVEVPIEGAEAEAATDDEFDFLNSPTV